MSKKKNKNKDFNIEIGLKEGKTWSKSKIVKVKKFVKKQAKKKSKKKKIKECPYDDWACRVYSWCDTKKCILRGDKLGNG